MSQLKPEGKLEPPTAARARIKHKKFVLLQHKCETLKIKVPKLPVLQKLLDSQSCIKKYKLNRKYKPTISDT